MRLMRLNNISCSTSFTTGPAMSSNISFCWTSTNGIFSDWTAWDWLGTVLFKNPIPFDWTGWDKSKTQSCSYLPGSSKVNMRNPKNCLSRIFHFKLVRFSAMKQMHGTNTCPYLKLKTHPSGLYYKNIQFAYDGCHKWHLYNKCNGQL